MKASGKRIMLNYMGMVRKVGRPGEYNDYCNACQSAVIVIRSSGHEVLR